MALGLSYTSVLRNKVESVMYENFFNSVSGDKGIEVPVDPAGLRHVPSRRSSLESSDEPELIDIQPDSQPHTADEIPLHVSTGARNTPVEIPHATMELNNKVGPPPF